MGMTNHETLSEKAHHTCRSCNPFPVLNPYIHVYRSFFYVLKLGGLR